jgi:5,5'-dehydrodivanillate O-demethylase
MLAREASARLTMVGAKTPAGKLLRQYWHPVLPAKSIKKPGSIRTFELLGERLVVYRALNGDIGVAPERCPHRGASLAYGFVEPDGIRCAYHGWRFNVQGECMERPFEPTSPPARCHLPPYQARTQAGLVFVSLRPDRPPPFPLWDILNRRDGDYEIQLQDDLACNWLQVQENAADTTHTVYLHARALGSRGLPDGTGFDAPLLGYGFQPFQFGMVKSWSYRGENGVELTGWGNPLIFPTMMRIETEMHWRVPLNDHETRVIILRFGPRGNTKTKQRGTEQKIRHVQLPKRTDGDGRYTMSDFYSQDAMAWETQGVVADRVTEILGASDVGISMYRQMLSAAIDANERGEPPPAQGTGSEVNLREWMNGYLPMSAPVDPTPTRRRDREEVFDQRHRTFEVPPRD